jgi:hypothetical protein
MANFVAFQIDGFQNDAFQTYVVEVPINELRRFAKIYAREESGALVALSEDQKAVVFSRLDAVVASTEKTVLFVQHKENKYVCNV